MVIESISTLVETIRRHRLLEPAQLEEMRRFAKPSGGAHALAGELVRRNWLTAFQANQLLAGRGAALVLGPYLVLERLGEGATGQVFKARHVHMRRVVAIKVIRPELLTDGEVLARFYREIQVISRLTHPHVVHAYDAGPIGRTHFLTMEYVEGINLADLVQRQGPLPAPKACEFARQAALGLQHAHEKGLVHRDVKPSNLILTQASSSRSLAEVDLGARTLVHGIVKVLDLGLARLPRNKDEAHSPALTLAGRGMMGTPDYLAPEQALDLSQADIRSDLYSLGCVLYFLLTGQPPFPGGTLAQKLMKHQQAPPPPLAAKRPGLPPELCATVNRLLAKEPDARYQTPAELATALAPLAGVLQPANSDTITLDTPVYALPVAVPRSRLFAALRKRRWLLMNLGGVLLLGALLLVFGTLLSRRNPGNGSSDVAATFDDINSPVLRPLLARLRRYRAGAGEDPEPLRQALLAVQREHGSTPEALQAARMVMQLPSPLDRWNNRPAHFPYALPSEVVAVLGEPGGRSWSEVTCLAASPAGKRVAGAGPDGIVRIWNADTLQETVTLQGEGAIFALAWSGDGQTLAAADHNYHVRVWNLAAATPRLLENLELPAAYVNGVALAPDGKSLAATCADGKVHLWSLGGAGAKEFDTISGPAGWTHGIAFSSDGKAVAAGFSNGTIGLLDMTVKKPTARFWKGHEGPVRSLSFSADGKRLAACGDRDVHVWSLDNPPRSLAAITLRGNGRLSGVALAPDGKTLAVAVPAVQGIHLWDLTANPPRQTTLPAGHLAPVQAIGFAPDGKTLFSGGLDRTVRQWDVSAMPPRERKSAVGPGMLNGFALSADSRLLATHARSNSFLQLWDLNGSAPRSRDQLPLPTANVGAITFAPDGKHLGAVTGSQPSLWDLAAAKPRSVTLPTLPGRGFSLAFAPDSRGLAVAYGGSEAGLRLWQLNGQPKERIALGTPGVPMISLAFTPDGKELAAVGSDWKARFWAVNSASLVARPPLPDPGGPFGGLGFGPDSTLAVFESREGRVGLWDRSAAKAQRRLGLGGIPVCRVHTLAFAPDGRSVAVAGDGPESLSLHELPSGRKLRTWSLPGQVDAIEFASDGRHLLTLNGNGTAYLFRLAR